MAFDHKTVHWALLKIQPSHTIKRQQALVYVPGPFEWSLQVSHINRWGLVYWIPISYWRSERSLLTPYIHLIMLRTKFRGMGRVSWNVLHSAHLTGWSASALHLLPWKRVWSKPWTRWRLITTSVMLGNCVSDLSGPDDTRSQWDLI